MTKEIKLTQNKVAKVSDHRFAYLSQWAWHAAFSHGRWYAVRKERSSQGQKRVWMHREIMGVTDPKIEVDHRDNDGLNNQDENLRVSTHSQNQSNRGPQKNSKTGLKGVSPVGKKYRAQIRVNRKAIPLGDFSNPIDAARAYDVKARELFGEFAWTNFKD